MDKELTLAEKMARKKATLESTEQKNDSFEKEFLDDIAKSTGIPKKRLKGKTKSKSGSEIDDETINNQSKKDGIVESVVSILKDTLIIPLTNELTSLKQEMAQLKTHNLLHFSTNLEITPGKLAEIIKTKNNIPISTGQDTMAKMVFGDADEREFLLRYTRSRREYEVFYKLWMREMKL